MGQTQTTSSPYALRAGVAAARRPSHKAEAYRWGVEIECFLPERAINELDISIGYYHHGHPLSSPLPL